MKIRGEEVEVVTDFALLRPGMIVWTIPCRWCSANQHRVMLAGRFNGTGKNPDGSNEKPGPRFDVVPAPRCAGQNRRTISEESVSRRIVYRVVDGLEQSTESRKSVTA